MNHLASSSNDGLNLSNASSSSSSLATAPHEYISQYNQESPWLHPLRPQQFCLSSRNTRNAPLGTLENREVHPRLVGRFIPAPAEQCWSHPPFRIPARICESSRRHRTAPDAHSAFRSSAYRHGPNYARQRSAEPRT